MSPEALARLREAVEWALSGGALHVDRDDARALLDAHAAMEKERDEALAAGRTVVEAADEMRQQWAEIEEDMTNERDAVRAEGVAAERARVVAHLRSVGAIVAADEIERGEHDEEGT